MVINEMKKIRWILYVFVIISAFYFIFGMQPEIGETPVDKAKTIFVSEKEVTQSIEGMNENINLTLNEGKGSEYVIYVDQERYKMNKIEVGDIITTKEPLDDRYPEVSMTITQHKEKSVSEIYEELKKSIQKEYPHFIFSKPVKEPIEGYMIFAKKDGVEWNTEITKIYVFDNGAKGSFVAQQKLFSEAEEGHGAHFDTMLKEFHIVPK